MDDPTPRPEEDLPPYIIEGARSSRSRCKTCRRKIDKGSLRIGIRVEGPYGVGHMWHHLGCAATRRFEDVEEAYRLEAWNEAKEPPARLPRLDQLRTKREQADRRRETRKPVPRVEVDPSGRARCKACGEPLAKGELRVVLARQVEFGGQVRTAVIQVHPGCVGRALEAEDSGTEADGLEQALRSNSAEVPEDRLAALLARLREQLDPPI
jgi:hypothetical protein